MGGGKLSDRERLFLYALSRHPGLGDAEISDRFDLSRSTATSIRKRLLTGGYYSLVNVPDFGRLGAEMFSAHYADFNPLGDAGDWWKAFQKTTYSQKAFLYLGTNASDFMLSATRNFTEVKAGTDELLRLGAGGEDAREGHPESVYFPLSLSKHFINFDFSKMVADLLDVSPEPDEGIDFKVGAGKPASLNDNQKRILYEVVRSPHASDDDICRRTGLSRQTVNATRQKLKREGLYSAKILPNFEKLGISLLASTHTTYNPKTPIETRARGIAKIVSDSSQFFIISTDTESVRLSAFRDYGEFQSKYAAYVRNYRKQGFILENPVIRLHPVGDDFRFRVNFERPLKAVLGL